MSGDFFFLQSHFSAERNASSWPTLCPCSISGAIVRAGKFRLWLCHNGVTMVKTQPGVSGSPCSSCSPGGTGTALPRC